MRTDWNLTVPSFIERISIPGAIGALNQYIEPPGFLVETTKLVDIKTRTRNISVGIDSSGLYIGQDVKYTLGLIYPNTKIIGINEGINVVNTQNIKVGITTTLLFGVNTSLISEDLKILGVQNIIQNGTSIENIFPQTVENIFFDSDEITFDGSGRTFDSSPTIFTSGYIEIFPPTLNTTGIITTNLSFYEGSGEYTVTLSAPTTNNFDQFTSLDFGIGTVVGIGSTFIYNTNAYFPNGSPKVINGDKVAELFGIIGAGYTVTGIGSYVSSSSIEFFLKTEINPYVLPIETNSVNVGIITEFIAVGDRVRGQYFDENTLVTFVSTNTVVFDTPSLNTFTARTSVGFTRFAEVSQVSNIVGINTKGIFLDDYVVSEIVDPYTFVTSVGLNEITLNQPTINGSETTGDIGITTDIITGINTTNIDIGYEILEIPGVVSAGTTITGFVKESVTVHIQENSVGVLTTRLFNIRVTDLLFDSDKTTFDSDIFSFGPYSTGIGKNTKLKTVSSVIAEGTYVVSVADPIAENTTFDSTIDSTFDSDIISFDAYPVEGYIDIFPKTLNNLGIATTTLTFYNDIYNLSISNFTQNTSPIEDQLFNIFLTTNAEFLFGNYDLVEVIKNNIFISKSGINTVPVGIATFTFGYDGDLSKVTTAEDYGDILDVTFTELGKTITPNSNIIQVNTSNISEGQYLKPVTEVFDNELGTFVEVVNQNSIKINVGSSNTTNKTVNLKIGNLITKESKRYTYDEFDDYTIQFLTIFPRTFVVENSTAFPAYANPPGSSNGDPSLRYSFTSTPKEFDVNKTLGIKDFPYEITSRELAAARGRRNYESPLYPRHVFGR